ncbi:hypothetical protein KSW81_008409 [Nannochloris sp. 'desiccata']|nr:hypothetical protein KSW81_008409 [Chlorella desiccata (nom. nud.)]
MSPDRLLVVANRHRHLDGVALALLEHHRELHGAEADAVGRREDVARRREVGGAHLRRRRSEAQVQQHGRLEFELGRYRRASGRTPGDDREGLAVVGPDGDGLLAPLLIVRQGDARGHAAHGLGGDGGGGRASDQNERSSAREKGAHHTAPTRE